MLRSSALFGPPWAANAPDAAPKMSTAAGLVKEPMPENVMEVRSLEVYPWTTPQEAWVSIVSGAEMYFDQTEEM
jgi:hypothetical protein